MGQVCVWLWDDVNKVWVKAQCTTTGIIKVKRV